MDGIFQCHALKTSERRLSAAIDDAHAIIFEVLRKPWEFGLPQIIRLALCKFWPMLAKPVIFAIRGFAAIHAQQDDRFCAPKVSQIDGLIA